MTEIVKYIMYVFILGLFLYSKLLPFQDRLEGPFKSVFSFFNSIFSPVFSFMKRFIKPFQVGRGLSVDMTQIVLLILFLLILNFR